MGEPRIPPRRASFGRSSAAAALAALAALFLAACPSSAAPDGAEPGTGTLRVDVPASLGSGARSVVPDFVSLVDRVSVTVSSGSLESRTKETADSAGTLVFTGLEAADWTVTATAYKDGAAIGSGGATVSVSSGSSSTVVLSLAFAGYSSGTGTLALPLSWPSATGVDYVEWSLDGGASTAAAVGSSGGNSSAEIGATLSAGAHVLALSFKAGGAGGTPAGTFVEAVNVWADLTSDSWMDGGGAVRSALSFEASDFLDSNTNLGGLIVRNGTAGGALVATGFSSGVDSYDFFELPSLRSVYVVPASSVDGQYITYSWNGGASTALASGAGSGTLSFDSGTYDNVLAVAVRAPDRSGSKTYTFAWHAAEATIGVDTSTDHQYLGFPDSAPSVARGSAIVLRTDNPVLAAIGTGWTWRLDGAVQAETSETFTLSGAQTNTMLGSYLVSAQVVLAGIAYSGSCLLTVHR